jgi:hypothetical protein
VSFAKKPVSLASPRLKCTNVVWIDLEFGLAGGDSTKHSKPRTQFSGYSYLYQVYHVKVAHIKSICLYPGAWNVAVARRTDLPGKFLPRCSTLRGGTTHYISFPRFPEHAKILAAPTFCYSNGHQAPSSVSTMRTVSRLLMADRKWRHHQLLKMPFAPSYPARSRSRRCLPGDELMLSL